MECLFCHVPTFKTKYCSKSCKGKYWYSQNTDHNKTLSKQWRDTHKAERRAAINKYRSSDKYRETANKKQKHKRLNNLNYRIAANLRSRLSKAVRRNKIGSAVSDLGCDLESLKTHLESQFEPNMSWANYGEWEIDHIQPLSSVDLSDIEEFKKVCNYKNLRPMWELENKIKSNKVGEE